MIYDAFQTATGTLQQIDTDEFGDEVVVNSFPCQVDPVFGFRRGFNEQNEQITGRTTILDGLPEIDLSHRRGKLQYEGNEYQIEDLTPFPSIGSNVPDHYEVMLQ